MTVEFPKFEGAALIVGGGPSVTKQLARDIDYTFPGRVIVLNEAGLSLIPHAEIFYWADDRWGKWNRLRYEKNKSPWKYTSAGGNIQHFPTTRRIVTDNSEAFHTTGDRIVGMDSGSRAINLAYHCGFRRVYLVGFDMHDHREDDWRDGYWHDEHQDAPQPNVRRDVFIPQHEKMAGAIPSDFEVFNSTVGSALKCWPFKSWREE